MSELSIPDQVEGVLALLTDRSKWTSHANARDTSGRRVHPASEEAVKWNVSGALVLMSSDRRSASIPAMRELDRLVVQAGLARRVQHIYSEEELPDDDGYVIWESVDDVNDRCGHACMIDFLRYALAALRQENPTENA